jgi:hypothetical protein
MPQFEMLLSSTGIHKGRPAKHRLILTFDMSRSMLSYRITVGDRRWGE